MQFEVLGPLRVRSGGHAAPLTATMPRTLLGMLLVRANSPVAVDVLVDALWAGRPDPRAAKKLQLHVHRLRRALDDPGRIRFEHGGYMVRVAAGELDAQRFEELLAEGAERAAEDAGRAVAALREALALWRGEPFGDVADVELLRAESDRLTELRLAGLEELYTAELAGGHATAIVPELAELAARHPLRERLQCLLMTALYRAGRQVEALEVHRRTRAALVDELGLEPGPELQRVQQAILTGELELDVPAAPAIPPPAQLPTDVADFTGRDAQLAAIREHLTGEAAAMPISAIAGTAGVGKTTLAVHAAHQLSEHFPDGQLYVNLRGAEAQPLDPAGVLARFLRALGTDGSAMPHDLEERAALYRSRLAGRRMLVLLDNAAGEAQLRPLLPGAPGCAVLVTSRARLGGLQGARRLDLGILDEDQAVELLARVAGPSRVTDEPSAAEQIVRLCGSLPLAVRISGARLAARPHWRLARLATDLADEHRRLDELRLGDLEVRASLALSYQSLGEQARCAFRRLGLLDAPDFAAWVVAALVSADGQVGAQQAEDLVDALVDSQLLDVAGRDAAGQLRYRFHDLLRTYARELAAQEPAAERLAALQRAFGGWLALAEAAGQRVTSSAFGVTFDSISGWQPDGSVGATALADPLGWFEAEWAALISTVEQARATGSDGLTCALAERLAAFFVVRGRYDDWRRICELMLSAAQHAGDLRLQGMALRGLGELDLLQYRIEDSIARFDRARAAFGEAGERHGHALATSGLGAAKAEAGRFADAALHLPQAVRELQQLGDHRSEAWALRRLGTMHQLQGRIAQAALAFQQALAALGEFADPLGRAGVLERLGAVRTSQGRGREAHDMIERSLALRRQHHDRFGEARALRSLGELYRAESHWDQALNCLGDALRLWRELGLGRELAATLTTLAAVHEDAGNTEAARTARHEAQRLP